MNLEILKELENKELISIGRASDLLWLQFDELITIKNYKGMDIKKGSMGLNIQCTWRFIKKDKIILGNNDIYMPIKENFHDEFDWSKIGESAFDEKSKKIIQDLLPLTISTILLSKTGDLKIIFDKEVVLEVIVNGAVKTEFWRFINYKTDKHIVWQE